MRANMESMDSVADCSSAIAVLEEVRRLHRTEAWPVLLDRYSTLKKTLVAIRSSNSQLSIESKSRLQSAIQHLTTMENRVETALSKNRDKPDVARLNRVISKQIEALAEVLSEIRSQIGG